MPSNNRLFIPKRDPNKTAIPKPNNLSFQQALYIAFIRYEKALEKLSKV